jgi:uncharacterized protein (DUF2235 family)
MPQAAAPRVKEEAMAKNIVFCADGTWNGPGQDAEDPKDSCPSNVFKLYLGLAGQDVVEAATYRSANEQERVLRAPDGTVRQVAKYLHGVGDSDNFLVKALGGAFGAGVITRIVRGYTFLSRQYEPGDRLFILGFSRGAYTARALAGLVCAKGLLDARRHDLRDKEEAYRLGSAVWADYRGAVCRKKDATWAQQMESMLDHLPRFFGWSPRAHLVPDVPVEAVAVWDTVGALGIPQYQADCCRLDVFRFCDTQLSPRVRKGLHAVAVDEQRRDFTPTLWDADPGRIEQVLFPGAHADVGGGYPLDESGLSDGALAWMTEELAELALCFSDAPPLAPRPDPLGPAHEPWTRVPWNVFDPLPRANLKGLKRHPSVAQRWGRPVLSDPERRAKAVYQPANL